MPNKNPPWWPSASLRLHVADACTSPVTDEGEPPVCERCAILISEHAISTATATKRKEG